MPATTTKPRRIALDQVRIEKPCPVSWDAMEGDQRARHCDHCGLNVHNLSAMTADEAQRLICESAGRLCVAYVPSAEGAVTTLEYHRQKPPKYRWRWVAAIAAFGAVSSGVVAAIVRPWGAPPAPVGGLLVKGAMVQPMVLGEIAPPALGTLPERIDATRDDFGAVEPRPDSVNCASE